MSENKNIVHYKYIDSLRGWAIFGVIVTHVGQIIPIPSWLEQFTGRGAQGPQLFFLVSSLTLFLSYKQRQMVDGDDADRFFYIRRFFRIAPTFYIASIFYLLLAQLNHHSLTGYFDNINLIYVLIVITFLGLLYPTALTILPHFGSLTVMIEMFYYAFVPFLYKKINSLSRAAGFFIITLLFFKLLEVFLHFINLTESISTQIMFFPEQLPVFALGIVCYFLIANGTFRNIYAVPILLISMIYLIFFAFYAKNLHFLPISIVYSIGFAGVVLAMSIRKFTLLQNPITVFIGKISYSIYLWHFASLSLIPFLLTKFNVPYNTDPLILFVLSVIFIFAFIVPISLVSYRVIEKGGIRMGNKIIKRISDRKNGSAEAEEVW